MTLTDTSYPVASTPTELARRTTLGVLVAVVAALAVVAVAGASGANLGSGGPQSPFAAPPIVGSSVFAGVGAAVAYAALVRLTDRPTRNFVVLAGVAFLVMMIPVFAFAPTLGVTAAGQAVLVALHVVVAVPLVAFVVGAVRR